MKWLNYGTGAIEMSRPLKNTVDYFSHYCTPDRYIQFIEKRHGNNGYVVYFKIQELLCQYENHYIDLSNEAEKLMIQDYINLDYDLIESVLMTFVEIGFIDKKLWNCNQIIWCQSLVDKFKDVYNKRRTDLPCKENIIINPIVSDVNNSDNSEYTVNNSDNSEHSVNYIQRKETKETKETKEKNTAPKSKILSDSFNNENPNQSIQVVYSKGAIEFGTWFVDTYPYDYASREHEINEAAKVYDELSKLSDINYIYEVCVYAMNNYEVLNTGTNFTPNELLKNWNGTLCYEVLIYKMEDDN